MHSPAHARIVKWLLGVVDPDRLDSALVVTGAGHARGRLELFSADLVKQASIIDTAREERCPQGRRKGLEVVELDAIQVGQALIPVVGVALHYSHFFINALYMPERASTRSVQHLAQVIVVVLESFLAHDDVPAAGKRPQDER